jgi:quercetin dioxygenase-like cupin family protein
MRNRFVIAVATAILGATAIGGMAFATPAQLVTSTTLATGSLDPVNFVVKSDDWVTQLRTKGQTSMTVTENRVAAGGTFGWHSHPGPSLVIVKAGSVTFYLGDDPTCTGVVHSTGDAYIDPGSVVHIARNETAEEAIVIVTRFAPVGVPTRIDQPSPGICSF